LGAQPLAGGAVMPAAGVRVDRALEFKRLDEGFFSEDE
jgi:hypothetical protein